MAKIEIEISDEKKIRLEQRLRETGQSLEDFYSNLIDREIEPVRQMENDENPMLLPHDEWSKRFRKTLSEMPVPKGHLTDEDLRRVNIYEDEI